MGFLSSFQFVNGCREDFSCFHWTLLSFRFHHWKLQQQLEKLSLISCTFNSKTVAAAIISTLMFHENKPEINSYHFPHAPSSRFRFISVESSCKTSTNSTFFSRTRRLIYLSLFGVGEWLTQSSTHRKQPRHQLSLAEMRRKEVNHRGRQKDSEKSTNLI